MMKVGFGKGHPVVASVHQDSKRHPGHTRPRRATQRRLIPVAVMKLATSPVPVPHA